MNQISISRLKQIPAEEIKDGGCFELTADGEPIAIVIVGAISTMKQKVMVLASQIDAMRGK